MNLRRLRSYLLLTLRDVSLGTGLTPERISAFEWGKVKPNPVEQASLMSFYRSSWQTIAEDERKNLQLREN